MLQPIVAGLLFLQACGPSSGSRDPDHGGAAGGETASSASGRAGGGGGLGEQEPEGPGATEPLGDRQVPMHIVYPPGAMSSQGGPVIDVTQPPYNAKGDGVTDDTAAFKALLNDLADEVVSLREGGIGGDPRKIVYLPNGTYLVSEPLVHDGTVPKGFSYLRLVGESRDDTVIRLADESPAFSGSEPRAVLNYVKLEEPHQSNIMWGNQLRNVTIDVGSGNPAAAGVLFLGANSSSIDNVTIRSEDGSGTVGLWLPTWSVQGHYSDITIEGFDDGVRCEHRAETQPTLEHLTLRGQRKVAIRPGPCVMNLRKVASDNTVPAIVVDDEGGHTVVLRSRFSGGDPEEQAIVLNDSGSNQLFMRDVTISGYGSSLSVDGESVSPNDAALHVQSVPDEADTVFIESYRSGPAFSFGETTPRTLRLPVVDQILVPWEDDIDNWASPEDFEGTDPEKIQQALDSGKSAIYLPKSYVHYAEETVFSIPASVRQLEFLSQDTFLRFDVAEASAEPLFVEHSQRRSVFRVTQQRDLIVRNGSMRFSVETSEPVTAHFSNLGVLAGGHEDRFCPENLTFFGRSLNEEAQKSANFVATGCTMWVMGFKTEAHWSAFEARDGAQLEVLGGYQNFAALEDGGHPVLHNVDSLVSYIGTSYMSRCYDQGIWQTKAGNTQKLLADGFPVRDVGHHCNYFVPLFFGDAR